MLADVTELKNRHKRIRSGNFLANGRGLRVHHMNEHSRHSRDQDRDPSRNVHGRKGDGRNENGADLARVLAALALLAWLSSWDGQDAEAARNGLAHSTSQSATLVE